MYYVLTLAAITAERTITMDMYAELTICVERFVASGFEGEGLKRTGRYDPIGVSLPFINYSSM